MGCWLSRKEQPQQIAPINNLADSYFYLLHFFKHLPLHDRLAGSEVCQHWNRISRVPWRDVVTLDLTTIPSEHLAAIVKRCTNLRTVVAERADLNSRALRSLSHAPLLSTVKLHSSTVLAPGCEHVGLFSMLFSERCSNTIWQELVLDDINVSVAFTCPNEFAWGNPPLTLDRLQLSGLQACGRMLSRYYAFFADLGWLHNLTCLILHGLFDCPILGSLQDIIVLTMGELNKLTNLRELCIGHIGFSPYAFDITYLPFLPKLQVLFLLRLNNDSDEDLVRLVTKHPSLRILVITGHFRKECTIPVRRRYTNGLGSDRLPLLHVFLGKMASQKIRFTKSPSTVLKVWPISEPLPRFLQREEIAPIFNGVWIAAQIKESAERGTRLGSDFERASPATSVITLDNA